MGVHARNSNEKMVKLTTIELKKMTVVATRKRVSTHTRNEINSDQHISSTIGFSEYTANGMIKDVSTGNLELVKVAMEASKVGKDPLEACRPQIGRASCRERV